MSKIAIGLKIDLSKMDMNRIFNGKNGAQYLDATIFVDMNELDQYGNSGMITQDVTKDEKSNGVKGNILGNGKLFWVENGQAPQQAQPSAQQAGFQQQAPQQSAGGFQAQAPQQPTQQQGYSSQTPAQQQKPYVAPQQGYTQPGFPNS